MDTTNTRPRAFLLARLAAERANLLTQLLGVDETTLTRSEVMPGWSPAMLLAHVGFWDAFYADRLAKLSDGRRAELISMTEDEMHHRNEGHRIRIVDITFPEALALCRKERRGFLAALSRTPDELLLRRTRLGIEWRTTPVTWVRRRFRHDAGHAVDLAHWRTALAPSRLREGFAHRSLLGSLLGLARQEFLSIAALVPPGERTTHPLPDHRTLQQVISMLAGLDEASLLAFDGLRRGNLRVFVDESGDMTTFESQLIVRSAEKSWAEVWEQFHLMRRVLLRLIDNMPADTMNLPIETPWHTTTTPSQFLLCQVQREQKYADILRVAMGMPPLPRRLRRSAPK